MYYSYHGTIHRKLQEGKLVCCKIVDSYNGISPAMLFIFSDGKIMPVRSHRFEEYFALSEKLNFEIQDERDD